MVQDHDDNADVWVGGFRNKVAVLLGISPSSVVWALTAAIFIASVAVILAVSSGTHLYRQYQAGEALSAETSQEQRFIEQLQLPTTLQPGEALIGDEDIDAVCSMQLVGETGIAVGWVWDEAAQVCRRYRRDGE